MGQKNMPKRPGIILQAVAIFSCFGCVSNGSQEIERYSHEAAWHEMQKDMPEAFIFRPSTDRKIATLTFDDGPSDLSDSILDLLETKEIAATFFWQGNNLGSHPATVKRAIENGHTVAQHSWDHRRVGGLTPSLLWQEQVAPTNKEFIEVAGHPIRFYRPPYGQTNQRQVAYVHEKGVVTVGWSLTSDDWDDTRNSPDEVVDRVLARLHPGAIVLLHDYSRGADNSAFVATVKRIIEGGQAQGYDWVSLDRLLADARRAAAPD